MQDCLYRVIHQSFTVGKSFYRSLKFAGIRSNQLWLYILNSLFKLIMQSGNGYLEELVRVLLYMDLNSNTIKCLLYGLYIFVVLLGECLALLLVVACTWIRWRISRITTKHDTLHLVQCVPEYTQHHDYSAYTFLKPMIHFFKQKLLVVMLWYTISSFISFCML